MATGGRHLVGRSAELAVLDEVLDRAAAGAGGCVIVEGAAGLGKSRLLAEAAERAQARQMRVVGARGVGPEKNFPFALALQLFDVLVGEAEHPGLMAGAASLAAPLFSGVHTEETTRSPIPLLRGLYWLTVNLARMRPLLVCVDDTQWSDELSLRFLGYLIHRIEDLPIAVVVAARPDEAGAPNHALTALRDGAHARQLLSPLGAAEVGELVRSLFPGAEPEFCAACTDVTGGNPFYVCEVLLSITAEHLPPTAASSERLREVGFASVSRAALFRLGRLGADAIELARALSVFGDGTPLRLVASLSGLGFDRAAEVADGLAAEELVASGPTMSFVHPLIGQLVYDDQPAVRGGLAHKQAARLLSEEGVPPETVAAHLLLAPPSGDTWVVNQLRVAARSARGKGAPAVAARLLARAEAEPPEASVRVEVLAELGTAEAAAGDARSVEHLQASLKLCTHRFARIDVRRQIAGAQAALGQRRQAAATLEAALGDLGDDSGDRAYAVLGDYLANSTFEPGLRQRAMARVSELLGTIPIGDTPAERALLAALAMRSGQSGALVTNTVGLAERAWHDGQLLTEEGVDGSGWLMTVWALAFAADHPRTEYVAAEAMRAAQAAGSVNAFATASYFRAWGRAGMGQLVEAQADVEQAVRSGHSGWRRYLVAALALKATLLVQRDELDLADGCLTEAAGLDAGSGIEVPWRLHAAGRLAMARRDPSRAYELFTSAGEFLHTSLGVDYSVLGWRTDAARAAVSIGELERGRALLEQELDLVGHSAAPGPIGRVLRVQALIERGSQGVEVLRQACGYSAAAGERLEQAGALVDLGALLRRQGARVDAREPLTEGLALANHCGARALAEQAHAELDASGSRREVRQITGPDSLTPSERRIADYARTGLTNSQIAQALFVTPKTVEYHLRHVYQKLAISGRAQLDDSLLSPSPRWARSRTDP